MKRIYVKNRIRRKGQYQFFMHQFVEECIKKGIRPKAEWRLLKGGVAFAWFSF